LAVACSVALRPSDAPTAASAVGVAVGDTVAAAVGVAGGVAEVERMRSELAAARRANAQRDVEACRLALELQRLRNAHKDGEIARLCDRQRTQSCAADTPTTGAVGSAGVAVGIAGDPSRRAGASRAPVPAALPRVPPGCNARCPTPRPGPARDANRRAGCCCSGLRPPRRALVRPTSSEGSLRRRWASALARALRGASTPP
jgi:hypothetical protein